MFGTNLRSERRVVVHVTGLGVGDIVVEVWQELQLFNPSGGYCVSIPWNVGLGRELTPAEVMGIMRQGKGKKKKRR